MPNARLRRRGQAPKPHRGAPKAQGLTAAIAVAGPSPMPSIAPDHPVSLNSTDADVPMRAFATLRICTSLTATTSCRPTVLISIRSSRCSPSSRRCCARPQPAQSRQLGGAPATAHPVHTKRMRQLLHLCRICGNLRQSCSYCKTITRRDVTELLDAVIDKATKVTHHSRAGDQNGACHGSSLASC